VLPGETEILQRERELVMRMKGRLFWPVRGAVTDSFGVRLDPVTNLTSKCSGIKVKTQQGTKVIAAMTGEVIYIGSARGLENFLVVDHGGKFYSLYGNLREVEVAEGDQIIRGEPFAAVAGERLHFEIREGKTPIDPLRWLRP
jgi:septal ring factor EnvC (AmiA/AmiB activator)